MPLASDADGEVRRYAGGTLTVTALAPTVTVTETETETDIKIELGGDGKKEEILPDGRDNQQLTCRRTACIRELSSSVRSNT